MFGFDPDNVSDIKLLHRANPHSPEAPDMNEITPMGYFAGRGDLPMMRWLYDNGADARDEEIAHWWPMIRAAADAVKWLIKYGAAEDVKRRPRPLWVTFGELTDSFQNLSKLLILNGALSKDDDSGDLDVDKMKIDLGPRDRCPSSAWMKGVIFLNDLLDWANDLHQTRNSFLLFLSGARSAQQHVYTTRRAICSVDVLGGKPGILLELIFDYTGVVCGRDVRLLSGKSRMLKLIGDYAGFVRSRREALIIRQLTELLPELIRTEHEQLWSQFPF